MDRLAFSVGGLLYSPAINPDVAAHVMRGDWPGLTSICLCLEDSIQDAALPQAEAQLRDTLRALGGMDAQARPLVFVRVKDPEHLRRVSERIADVDGALTGYVFPKFDAGNAARYLDGLARINDRRAAHFYGMPILESRAIADIRTRAGELDAVRRVLDAHRPAILNVRVGGNDFCNLFGLRRNASQTIYDIGVVRDILVDIVNVFSDDYVVSGPVWEYYGKDPDDAWAAGLRRELALDLANGFFGKTAIHPSQLPVISESLKAPAADAADAARILNWSDVRLAVAGSADGGRKNEVKCHGRWAERILRRAEIYGCREV